MQNRNSCPIFRVAIACAILSAFMAVAQTSTPPPKYLYSSDFNGNKVYEYVVNASTGAIKPTIQKSASTHTGPTRVASDKGGYRLYVINNNSKDLSAYFINRSNGDLSPVPGSPVAIGHTPTDVFVHPSGKYVYVTTFISTTTPTSFVYAFAVQSNGSLKPVPGSPFSTVNWARALTIDPQGKYLYVSNYPESSTPAKSEVDAYSINTTDGALTPVPGSPYVEPNSAYCANGAWDVVIHPSGNFLILPNMCEGIVVYRISRTTGTLTLVKGSPFPVPYPPGPVVQQSVAMDPLGQYLWISAQYCYSGCSQTTDTWKFNATTGVPTYLESGESACGLITRADPSGKFVYVIGDTQGSGCAGTGLTPGIWGMSVNRSNGSVKNITGSPWASPNSDGYLYDGLAVTP